MEEVNYRMPQLERRLGIANKTIYKHIREGWFPPPVKNGSASLWPVDEIDRYERALKMKATKDELKVLVADFMVERMRG